MSQDIETVKPTVQETVDSLNGYEELGIEQAFGKSVEQLSPTFLVRACAFVLRRRAGDDHAAAVASAMGTTIAGLELLFSEDPDDVMPDEPDSVVGKDDSQPASAPPTSLPSAS